MNPAPNEGLGAEAGSEGPRGNREDVGLGPEGGSGAPRTQAGRVGSNPEAGAVRGSGPGAGSEAADHESGLGVSASDLRAAKTGSRDPKARMERLDALIAAETDEERLRAGLGMRLALGMAQELKDGKPFGTDTSALVARWVEEYGQDAVEAAVKVAREFLTKPEELRKSLGQRLGLDEKA